MKDRVSLHPNRYKLTPVSGQADTYDLSRADEPLEVGTPLNKANLLSDDTATKLGLDPKTATPNDAWKQILLEILPSKAEVVIGTFTNTASSKTSASGTIDLGFRPTAVLVEQSNGNRASDNFQTSLYGGLAVDGYPLYKNAVTITDTGFTWTLEYVANIVSPNICRYIAFK